MSQEKVILVNEKDEWLGLADKLEAHEKGLLHRAFSVFVLNNDNELLLQRRALDKYHSGGLWTNTCCSHPRDKESTTAAAHRRLVEEMGFDCHVEKIFTYTYKADMGNGLTEHEYDHIYSGRYDMPPRPNEKEVCDYKYISIEKLQEWIEREPAAFTQWFLMILPVFLQHISKGRAA